MESEEHQEMWPVIGQSDVDDICRKICESIVELERAFEAGELSSKLTSGCFEQVLGPPLYEIYGKLAENAPGPLHHLRVDAVDALLAQLQNDLIPTQVAHAELRMPPEGDHGRPNRGRIPLQIALQTRRFERDPSFRSDARYALLAHRIQVRDARFLRCICSGGLVVISLRDL